LVRIPAQEIGENRILFSLKRIPKKKIPPALSFYYTSQTKKKKYAIKRDAFISLTVFGFLQTIFCSTRTQHSPSSLFSVSKSLQKSASIPQHITSPFEWPPKHCLNDGQYKPEAVQQHAAISLRSPIPMSVCSSIDCSSTYLSDMIVGINLTKNVVVL
jgi:hypothetical protein